MSESPPPDIRQFPKPSELKKKAQESPKLTRSLKQPNSSATWHSTPNGSVKTDVESTLKSKLKPPPPQKTSKIQDLLKSFEKKKAEGLSDVAPIPTVANLSVPKKPAADISPISGRKINRKEFVGDLTKKFESTTEETVSESPPRIPPKPGGGSSGPPQWQRKAIEPVGEPPSLPSRIREMHKAPEAPPPPPSEIPKLKSWRKDSSKEWKVKQPEPIVPPEPPTPPLPEEVPEIRKPFVYR